MFECADDGEEFTIPDWVITFCFGEGGVITHRVSQTIRVALIEDGACRILGGIDL